MKPLIIVAAAVVLAACQHQTKPQPVAPSAAVAAAETGARIEQQVQAQQERVASLEQRLTLVQEQLIQSNQSLSQLQQRAQQQLVALQQLQLLLAAADKGDTERGDDNSTLAQLMLLVERLEQMSVSQAMASPAVEVSGPQYRLVSAYTAQGEWVMLKYDEVTGLTWRAEGGRWTEVEESGVMLASRYQVVLRPAAGDIKGYVAARIDQESGRTWWLNGNRWDDFK